MMLTEMAFSSDRMRFKDKIIANIAKAIKGIQEAVYFKNQTSTDDSPLVLRNNDRQCHKLCENLDHVFLHGLKHHSNGYWKVVTEYTHKNAVKEIRMLQNVMTDLGRGRAWIFMALNDSLLESYIRCVTDNTKFLKKFYVKDALLLDQQQMSVLLTLTSGLECAVFQLEYDLPYLDLTAYPPRARTASEIEEGVGDQVSLRSAGSFSSHPSSETAASTPDSSGKVLSDSDSASMCSLDQPATLIKGGPARVSSVSMDSGFPGDLVSLHSGKQQRSVTPTTAAETMSVSSLGSAGEPDRLTRLENLVASRPEEVDENEGGGGGGGLEVIRMKGGKKAGSKKKKAGASSSSRKGSSSSARVVSPVSQNSSSTLVGPSSSLIRQDGSIDRRGSGELVEIAGSKASRLPGQSSYDGESPKDSAYLGKSPRGGKSLSGEEGGSEITDSGIDQLDGQGISSGSSRRSEKDLEDLAAETQNSLSDQLTQLDTAVASVRATATTLHQHQGTLPQQQRDALLETAAHQSSQDEGSGVQFDISPQSPSPLPPSLGSPAEGYVTRSTICDKNSDSETSAVEVPHLNNESSPVSSLSSSSSSSLVPQNQNLKKREMQSETKNPRSALAELESKCAELCMPYGQEKLNGFEDDIFSSSSADHQRENAKENINNLSTSRMIGFADEKKLKQSGIKTVSPQQQEDEVDFYGSSNKAEVSEERSHGVGQMQDYMDYISGHHDDEHTVERRGEEEVEEEEEKSEESVREKERQEWTQDYALRLDNNTKLQIMLEVFMHDDEKFVKMFVTREGHSEGDVKVTFVLVTSLTLYLLRQSKIDRKFETELAIPLKDLSFITLSLNKQIMNIESSGPNRRKERIWLTPGDHLLSSQLLECLDRAMLTVQQIPTVKSHCRIGSDEPLQTIALRKYISRDSNCEEVEVEIEDYSLVFWEDVQANKNKQTSTSREGTMLLRTNDPFKGHVWKPVYVILRDFMLCVFNDKKESKPQQYVRLGGEQCVGCRLVTSQDREFCIEVILANRDSWFLSVASEEEVASWRHSLCLAVSEGMQDSTNLSCLPCVSVVTGQKLLLCHEDVQTKFCRTIASAKVEEVTALTLDPEVNTYCILEFESQELGVSSERWVLYFNSPLEMDRFLQALSKVWKNVYQVSLVASEIEDLPLQRHCHDQVSLLQSTMAMK